MPQSVKENYPLLGALAAISFWIIDAFLELSVFHKVDTFYGGLFQPEGEEIWMRTVVALMMVLFGVYVKCTTKKIRSAKQELDEQKKKLDELVQERTEELESKNQELEKEIVQRIKAEKHLEEAAMTDVLTNIYNRRKVYEVLDYEIKKLKRFNRNLSVVLCDIDYFKKINDQYGHDVGDEVLIEFVGVINNNIRKSDTFSRYGGEEFCLLLPDTEIDSAVLFANKLREKVKNHQFEKVGHICVSMGVTQFKENDDIKILLKRADLALYDAKQGGRDKVVCKI